MTKVFCDMCGSELGDTRPLKADIDRLINYGVRNRWKTSHRYDLCEDCSNSLHTLLRKRLQQGGAK